MENFNFELIKKLWNIDSEKKFEEAKISYLFLCNKKFDPKNFRLTTEQEETNGEFDVISIDKKIGIEITKITNPQIEIFCKYNQKKNYKKFLEISKNNGFFSLFANTKKEILATVYQKYEKSDKYEKSFLIFQFNASFINKNDYFKENFIENILNPIVINSIYKNKKYDLVESLEKNKFNIYWAIPNIDEMSGENRIKKSCLKEIENLNYEFIKFLIQSF